MATTQKRTLLIWVIALAWIMACAPSFATPATQAVDPGLIGTFIARTANAASTQTVAMLPSTTLTLTSTPTHNLETATPTATSTEIFVFFTPTVPVIPPLDTITSSGNYDCHVTRVSPPNGSNLDTRQDFNVVWTIQNTGKRKWERNNVDYTYSSGAKMHKISSYDLPKDIPIGGTTEVGVDMRAPKTAGSYTTTWALRNGDRVFCPLVITIIVKEASN